MIQEFLQIAFFYEKLKETLRKRQEGNLMFFLILKQLYIDRLQKIYREVLCTFLFPSFFFLFTKYLCSTDFNCWETKVHTIDIALEHLLISCEIEPY